MWHGCHVASWNTSAVMNGHGLPLRWQQGIRSKHHEVPLKALHRVQATKEETLEMIPNITPILQEFEAIFRGSEHHAHPTWVWGHVPCHLFGVIYIPSRRCLTLHHPICDLTDTLTTKSRRLNDKYKLFSQLVSFSPILACLQARFSWWKRRMIASDFTKLSQFEQDHDTR